MHSGSVEAWADRNEYWQRSAAVGRRARAKRERSKAPLILCGHGVSLAVDRGTLLIRDGFTHYPQERLTYRLHRGDKSLPPRLVMLDGTGSLSFDVIAWLAEQNIPLVRIDWTGQATSIIGGSGHVQIPERIQWQIETRNDPARRLAFSCELIRAKLESSLRTLSEVVPDSSARMTAISRTEAAINRIDGGHIGSIDDLRMIEAAAAASYFKAWQGLPLIWRSKWKHPVPDAWLTIGPRNTLGKGGRSLSNRNAKHPMNAALNYAYGMLRSRVHIEAVAAGYDPRRGVMHHDRDDGDAFAWVFDMIEPRRAEVDAKILRFMLNTPLTGADFILRADGVCRLAPQLARRIAQIASETESRPSLAS